MVLCGHSADCRASSQAAAHSSKALPGWFPQLPPLMLGCHTHRKKSGSGVVRTNSRTIKVLLMHYALDITQPEELIPDFFLCACNVFGCYGAIVLGARPLSIDRSLSGPLPETPRTSVKIEVSETASAQSASASTSISMMWGQC